MKSKKLTQQMFSALIIGNGSVGKTSILERWAQNDFKVVHMPTIGKH
jgi:GTPase SAR1 family protein